MNKADEKQLKKDPRYAAVRDAHHRLRVASAAPASERSST